MSKEEKPWRLVKEPWRTMILESLERTRKKEELEKFRAEVAVERKRQEAEDTIPVAKPEEMHPQIRKLVEEVQVQDSVKIKKSKKKKKKSKRRKKRAKK